MSKTTYTKCPYCKKTGMHRIKKSTNLAGRSYMKCKYCKRVRSVGI